MARTSPSGSRRGIAIGRDMTPAELQSLSPWFREGERFLNGTVIDWSDIAYRTMFWMVELRKRLDSPIHLIRGAHPGKPTAVDACCPGRPLSAVYMALTRLQECSWGVYSGNSFHLDTRPFEYVPARWMAVKGDEEGILADHGLQALVTSRKDGWVYLSYDHDRAFEGLSLVLELARRKAA